MRSGNGNRVAISGPSWKRWTDRSSPNAAESSRARSSRPGRGKRCCSARCRLSSCPRRLAASWRGSWSLACGALCVRGTCCWKTGTKKCPSKQKTGKGSCAGDRGDVFNARLWQSQGKGYLRPCFAGRTADTVGWPVRADSSVAGPKFWEGRNVLSLSEEPHLVRSPSKHKTTRYARNLGGMAHLPPLARPMYAGLLT